MIVYIFALLTGIAGALSRDAAKVIKSPPYITNSLVNLGKMDISFYFNHKDQGMFSGMAPVTDMLKKMDLSTVPQNANFMFPKSMPIDEPCPCSMLRNYKDTNPSAVLNKILSSNDLFSFKNPMSSVLCCESHEDATAHEEPVFLELGPKPALSQVEPALSLPSFPFMLDNFFNKEMPFASPMAPKSKTIEILFFPKKTPEKNIPKTRYTPIISSMTKKDINIADKSLEKEFKSYDEKVDTFSVKKDLNGSEILETSTSDNKEPDENLPKENNNL